LIVSGGNIDANVLARVIERGLAKSGRLTRIAVEMSDRPGALAALLGHVADARANVLEVHHERTFLPHQGQAQVDLVLETRGPEHTSLLLGELRAQGFSIKTPNG
jgi:threonine dehydratase